jgi:cytochrome c oxidase subunit 2
MVSLALMAVVGLTFARAVYASDGPPAGANTNKARSVLLWGMIVFGIILSIGTLRENPHQSASPDAMVVNISGGQWWWEVDTYELPLGQEIEFRVTTEDVTHGMGIYTSDMTLVAQVQVMPGYTNSLVHTFDEPGTYQILCMEFCGIAHHDMINEFDVLEAANDSRNI